MLINGIYDPTALRLSGGTMAGNLLFTDGLYDIGATGATRPRDLFLSRNAVIGGTLNAGAITGTSLTASGLTLTRIPYASTAGLLIDSANLTFDGTNLFGLGYGSFLTGLSSESGVAPSDTVGRLHQVYTSSASGNKIVGFLTMTGTNNGLSPGSIYGINQQLFWKPAATTASRNLTTMIATTNYCCVDTTSIVSGTPTENCNLSICFDGYVKTLDSGLGNPTHTTVKIFSASVPGLSTNGKITTGYAFYDAGQYIDGTKTPTAWGFYGLTPNNYLTALQIGGTATVGMGTGTLSASGLITATGGINVAAGQVYKLNNVQVVGARVIDARCDDAINSGDATTDGVIDSLRDAMVTHGLLAAA